MHFAYARWLLFRLERSLDHLPSAVLLGPRQCGKTTLALDYRERLEEPALYVDLENPRDLAKLSDPSTFFESSEGQLVIIDEVQRRPDLFPILRSVIDERRRRGHRTRQFLLLGSSSPDLTRSASESLAGRTIYLELGPFQYLEVADSGDVNLQRHWVQGGYPESYFAPEDVSFNWRQTFIRTYLERDIQSLGLRTPIETLRRFWTMLAYQQGGLFNSSQIAASLGISSVSISRYLDLLEDLFLVRILPPWFGNIGKRLTKTPKVYVRDSGIVHALLGLRSWEDVMSHPVAGASWEGFVIDNLLGLLGTEAEASFYRTSNGAEIDLLVDFKTGGKVAIEVKRSASPAISKGFHLGADDVGASERYVVYAGEETYRMSNDVWAIGLPELMRRFDRRLRDKREMPAVTPDPLPPKRGVEEAPQASKPQRAAATLAKSMGGGTSRQR